ncbi:AAA family ATPase [Erwinia psidii]|uniref:endopeptidase La n=1 Tax=Erwinia psidii TaxID=69224 RepID=A0A3N6S065_9GAMM|nr:Lon protease family protein [Erwinia psidii]MCX8957424.1 Lon protease family protein [Erwinia psidii]RQM38157.1 Lon protease family protein [Erwinia psidii]
MSAMLNRAKSSIISVFTQFRKNTITLTNNRLEWRALQPDTDDIQPLFSQVPDDNSSCFASVQPRLFNGLNLLLQTTAKLPLMLIRSAENAEYFSRIKEIMEEISAEDEAELFGGHYQIDGMSVTWRPVASVQDNFASEGGIHYADWIEAEQLFGCVRRYEQTLTLQPGLLHQANGGTLMLSLRTLLAQPLLWLRLRKILLTQQYDWYSPDETRPLPVAIPPMPMQFRLVLAGERDALADFQEMEPDLSMQALYSEFEESLQIGDGEDFSLWVKWVRLVAIKEGISAIADDTWPVLICEGARYTGDQDILPLCPVWLSHQLQEALMYSPDDSLNGEHMQNALETREWREGFLADRVRDEILLDQVLIETEGEMIGQINALSVIEFPGHPRAFGEPSRLSCVVHVGDGEFTDVERKAELGGNIHAKGMMIMQAWLIAELELEQQLPFSASLVFEQSYSELDGDSASLAGLCALISALASQPVSQQIAVTGSVDQFGRVQAVGGLNEKIEGFFHICNQRTLSGKQGVIIPLANVRHLSLNKDVVNAVREEKFHIWAVSSIDEALPLLTGVEWDKENAPCLLRSIQERIAQITQQDRHQHAWPLRWLNWFNQN